MRVFLGEFIGTMILILLGNGVVANVLLKKSKGEHSGWIVISFGWGFAVCVAVYLVGSLSGAHLNPAVSLAAVLTGQISWGILPIYVAAQMLGAFLGAFLVYFAYYSHFQLTQTPHLKFYCFATRPAVYHPKWNVLTEIIATTVLILGVLGILAPHNQISPSMGPYLVGVLVTSIGLSLGGPTGYAMNPARDLAPRIAYTFLFGKLTADWRYAWIPICAPLIGSLIGCLLYLLLA